MIRTFPEAIDSTMLSNLGCEVKADFSNLQHWHPEQESIHLHAGAAYAKGMEVARKTYLATGNAAESEDAGIAAMIAEYGYHPEFDLEAKSCARMVGAMEHYFASWPFDFDPVRIHTLGGEAAVEFSFAIPLPINHPDTGNPIIFCGRTDFIGDFANGLYAVDDKTTSQLGASWSRQWELRGQFLGYAWAMREYGLKPAGTIIRGVSILKTKYDHAQAIIHQPDWRIDLWYKGMLAKVAKMLDIYRNGTDLFAFNETCNEYGGCPYKGACQTLNPVEWLSSYYVQREWKPLEKK